MIHLVTNREMFFNELYVYSPFNIDKSLLLGYARDIISYYSDVDAELEHIIRHEDDYMLHAEMLLFIGYLAKHSNTDPNLMILLNVIHKKIVPKILDSLTELLQDYIAPTVLYKYFTAKRVEDPDIIFIELMRNVLEQESFVEAKMSALILYMFLTDFNIIDSYNSSDNALGRSYNTSVNLKSRGVFKAPSQYNAPSICSGVNSYLRSMFSEVRDLENPSTLFITNACQVLVHLVRIGSYINHEPIRSQPIPSS